MGGENQETAVSDTHSRRLLRLGNNFQQSTESDLVNMQNCFGTDLNRNWVEPKFGKRELPDGEKLANFPPLEFGEKVSVNRCDQTYEGLSPMTEPEVLSLAKYVKKRQSSGSGIAAFVDVHSYSQEILPVR